MPYCTQANYVAKFGQAELIELTDRAGAAIVGVDVLATAQAAADSDIDKRLRMKGWSVPLALASTDILAIALDLSRFHLFSAASTEIVDAIEKTYLRRLRELDDYVAGKLMLDIGDPNTSTASAGDVDYYLPDPVFVGNLDGY